MRSNAFRGRYVTPRMWNGELGRSGSPLNEAYDEDDTMGGDTLGEDTLGFDDTLGDNSTIGATTKSDKREPPRRGTFKYNSDDDDDEEPVAASKYNTYDEEPASPVFQPVTQMLSAKKDNKVKDILTMMNRLTAISDDRSEGTDRETASRESSNAGRSQGTQESEHSGRSFHLEMMRFRQKWNLGSEARNIRDNGDADTLEGRESEVDDDDTVENPDGYRRRMASKLVTSRELVTVPDWDEDSQSQIQPAVKDEIFTVQEGDEYTRHVNARNNNLKKTKQS